MSTTFRLAVAPLIAGLLAVLVACGQGETDAGRESTGSSGESTAPAPDESSEPVEDGPVDFTEVALVSESNVEASTSSRPTVIEDRQAMAEYAGGFFNPRMTQSLAAAYEEAQVPDGEVLVGTVVAVGCETPTEVDVERAGGELQVTAPPMKSKVQCLVPITTVALVSVPEAAV